MAIKLNWHSAKLQKWAAFGVVFAMSLVFFVFLTFPYEIFKETLSNNIKRQTGLDVSIGEMGMSFPIGVKLSDVSITKPGTPRKVDLDTIRLNVGILPFLIGKLSVYVNIDALNGKREKGEFDIAMKAGIFSLLFKGQLSLSSFELNAKKFEVEQIASLGLGILAQKRNLMNPLFLPLVEAIQIKGRAQGFMDLSMSGSSPGNASGTIDLSMQQASLEMTDKTIPTQTFSKALLKADIKNGVITLDKNAGMTANDFSLSIVGKLGLKENIVASILDLKIDLRLDGELKETWGSILAGLPGASGEGQTSVAIQGTFMQPIPVYGSSPL